MGRINITFYASRSLSQGMCIVWSSLYLTIYPLLCGFNIKHRKDYATRNEKPVQKPLPDVNDVVGFLLVQRDLLKEQTMQETRQNGA